MNFHSLPDACLKAKASSLDDGMDESSSTSDGYFASQVCFQVKVFSDESLARNVSFGGIWRRGWGKGLGTRSGGGVWGRGSTEQNPCLPAGVDPLVPDLTRRYYLTSTLCEVAVRRLRKTLPNEVSPLAPKVRVKVRKARLLRHRCPSTRNFGAGPTPTPQQGAGSTLSPFGNFVVVRGTTPCKAPIAVLTSQNLKPSP